MYMGEKPTPEFLRKLKGDIAKGKNRIGATTIDLNEIRKKGVPKTEMPSGLRKVFERVKNRRQDEEMMGNPNRPVTEEDEDEPPSF